MCEGQEILLNASSEGVSVIPYNPDKAPLLGSSVPFVQFPGGYYLIVSIDNPNVTVCRVCAMKHVWFLGSA